MDLARRFSLAVALLVSASAAWADPICADRPGAASATCTAPAGHLQIETGIADWNVDESSLVIGATAIKYGVSDRSHIELDVVPLRRESGEWGFGDVATRYKQKLTGDAAAIQVSAYPFVKLPTARKPIGNGKVEGGLTLPIGYSVPHSTVSITFSPEIDWAADEDGSGHHLGMGQVVSIGVEIAPRLTLGGEVWRHWDWDTEGTTMQTAVDGSLAYLVNDDLQLDGGANFGLNKATASVELYFGVARRF